MQKAPTYGLEVDDDDSPANQMVNVVNVTDEEVRFRIASIPGSKPLRYHLAPYGKQGDRVGIQEGYANPYRGASRELMTPIIERLTARHVGGHEGAHLPMVVREERADEARAQWLRGMAAHKASKARKPMTVALEIDPEQLQPRAARVVPDHTPDPAVVGAKLGKLIGEEVGNEEIEPPHPDDAEVFATAAPEPEPEE